MTRVVVASLVLAVAAGIAVGWFASRAASPAITVEAVVPQPRTTATPVEAFDDYPLIGEEETELEDLLVEGEPLPARRGPRARSVVEAWHELAPRAEGGDARAAMQLFLALDACRRVLAPTPRETRQRERMDGALRQASAEWRERALRGRMELEAGCADADPTWLETGIDWLTQAADGDVVAAKLLWATRAGAYLDLENADDATRDWHARMSARYLDEAVAAGSAQAMTMVARRDAATDPVNALAHVALAYRVADERARAAALARGPSDNPRRSRFESRQRHDLESMMHSVAERLSAAQIAAAHRRADELYERCCRS